MDEIDRYFRRLRLLLPRDQREDILRELAVEIRAQIEERETARGRSLEPAERAAILSTYGHPLLTAARYRRQRYLIGPVMFPYYWTVLKVTLALVFLGHAVGAIVLLAGGGSLAQLGQQIGNLVATGLKVAAWITALGALADWWLRRSRALERWHPGPAIPLPQHARSAVATALAGVPGAHHTSVQPPRPMWTPEHPVASLLTAAVVSVWWLAGLRVPTLFFGQGAAGLEWGPDMDRIYPVLVVAQLALLAAHVARHVGADGTGISRAIGFAWMVTGCAVIYVVVTSSNQWMIWQPAAAARAATVAARLPGRDVTLVEFVNLVWSAVFMLVAIACVRGALTGIVRRWRRPAAAARVLVACVAGLGWSVSSGLAGQAPPPRSLPPLGDVLQVDDGAAVRVMRR